MLLKRSDSINLLINQSGKNFKKGRKRVKRRVNFSFSFLFLCERELGLSLARASFDVLRLKKGRSKETGDRNYTKHIYTHNLSSPSSVITPPKHALQILQFILCEPQPVKPPRISTNFLESTYNILSGGA